MALSVSGFPEPSRQVAPANEVFTGENGSDGSNKTTLMNSPRLRGLFGASGVPTKKPDTRISSTTSKAEETEGGIIPSTPPIAAASIAFATSFEPLSQEEYELELQLPMASSSTTPTETHRSVKRPQLPPLPRKSATSPVRLGPSLTRLDIGAFSRAPATHHPHSKAPPPPVVVEDWAPKLPDAAARPLPNVPNATTDQGTKVLDEYKGSDSNSAPVAGPSRHINAVASSSKHVNAVAGPSRQTNAMAGSSKHPAALSVAPPSPSIAAPITTKPSPPPSQVVTRQPSQRGHKGSSQSLSMRFQPLVAEPIPTAVPELSTENTLTSPVRPLPRIPPPAPVPAATLPPSPNPSSRQSTPVNIKRTKTTAGVVPSLPVGSAPNAISRSPFDNVPAWRSRPGMKSYHASRASSPPLPISSPNIGPRSRSHSRPRRDKSLDPYYPLSKPALMHGVPPIITTNVSGGRNQRSLPSPVIPGARPLVKAHTLEHTSSKSKPFPIQTGVASGRREPSSSGRVLSPGGGRRSQPPTPPAGPVRPRPKAVSLSSPSPPTISVVIPVQPQPLRPAQATVDDTLSRMEAEVQRDKSEVRDAPLHSHPMDALTDTDSLLHPPASPAATESPVEVFIDDQDESNLSRGPSPMRYARPDSRGHLSDSDELEDLDFASSSSTAPSPSASPTRRRRTQLRSYRMSYRPHAERTSPPPIPFRERDPIPQTTPSLEEKNNEEKKKDKKKQKKKYFDFGDFGGGSAPTTRASSPERKSRSRQPRKLADAVSLAFDEVRSKGRLSSTSPKRKLQQHPTAPSVGSNTPLGLAGVVTEVLDISRPRTSRRSTAATVDTTGSSSTSEHVPTTNSARSSAKLAWGKAPVTGGNKRLTGSSDHLHNKGMPTFAKDEVVEDYAYARRARTPRRTVSPAPPLPTPHHSFRSEDYNRPRTQSVTGGSKPRLADFNIVTTVTASRPPSSSTSSPFSAFSISNRSSTKSKTKHASTPSVALPADENVLVIQPESVAGQANTKEEEEADGAGDVSARMIMRTVDSGGDIWEHERKEDVADVIPHLRQLKAKR
ncbi:hypothetical protein D9619_011347 [Psilocybe cf. subviscida]|uniref:Uncharacterized protein n=1 Tax=Psilocybe cf. subviscida TaxID=2480587 RepID=A0A8H5BLA3_9AGAR|nr:hypothetical protein D9619_011347 [Psilocybe cf. subviscida]